VAGAIVLVIVLLLFPVLIAIAGLVGAMLLGWTLNQDSEVRHEGSELLDLNV
jgi:hypothetical protein